MRLALALILALSLLLIAMEGSVVEVQADPLNPRKGRFSDTAFSTFAPTDQISADQAVPFPTDI